MVKEGTNGYTAFSSTTPPPPKKKERIPDSNWEDTNAEGTEAYIGILIYTGVVDLPTSEYSFYTHLYMHNCKTGHNIKKFKKTGLNLLLLLTTTTTTTTTIIIIIMTNSTRQDQL
jgi:hypothetical protein